MSIIMACELRIRKAHRQSEHVAHTAVSCIDLESVGLASGAVVKVVGSVRNQLPCQSVPPTLSGDAKACQLHGHSKFDDYD